jgi:hypothetical protein
LLAVLNEDPACLRIQLNRATGTPGCPAWNGVQQITTLRTLDIPSGYTKRRRIDWLENEITSGCGCGDAVGLLRPKLALAGGGSLVVLDPFIAPSGCRVSIV